MAPRQPESIRCAEMTYAFSIGNPRSKPGSNRAEVSQASETEKVLRFGQSGCLLERRGGAEAALPTYRQMPRYRRQARREMPSFFILDWSVVRFMPRRTAAPNGIRIGAETFQQNQAERSGREKPPASVPLVPPLFTARPDDAARRDAISGRAHRKASGRRKFCAVLESLRHERY